MYTLVRLRGTRLVARCDVRVVSHIQKILIYPFSRVESMYLYVWLYVIYLYTLARLRDTRLLTRCDVLMISLSQQILMYPYSRIESMYLYVVI